MLLPVVFVGAVVVGGVALVVLGAWAWSVPLAALIKAGRKSLRSADEELTSAFEDKKEPEKHV